MSIDYTLVVTDPGLSPQDVLQMALPAAAAQAVTRPADEGEYLALDDPRGFLMTTYTVTEAYVQLQWPDIPDGIEHGGPGSPAEWTPANVVYLAPTMHPGAPPTAVHAVLDAVSRVLVGTTSDTAFVLNGALLLTRFDGATRRHNSSWWETHDPGHRIPGTGGATQTPGDV